MLSNEQRLRERRTQILCSGNGDEKMPLEKARKIAFSESIQVILDQDGEQISQTDPDLFDENGEFII